MVICPEGHVFEYQPFSMGCPECGSIYWKNYEKPPRFKVGDKVKFPDDIWEEKRELGLHEGFFSSALEEDSPNEFTVSEVSIIDDDIIEYRLKEYPWLVWEEELEKGLELADKIKAGCRELGM